MNNNTVAQTRFLYSEGNSITISNKNRCLYNSFTVAQHLTIAMKRYVSLYEIEAIEEWQHFLWVKLKGTSPRFVSKNKIQQDCSKPSKFGGILVNLSSRVVPRIESDDCTFITYLGYSDETLARKARSYILSWGLALTADVRLSKGFTAEEWELRISCISLAAVMHLALREVREEIKQKAIATIS